MKSAPLANTADKRAASSDGATGSATSSSAPATGIKIRFGLSNHCSHLNLTPFSPSSSSDTSMPPKQGVKYVCCGGCRQWLLAPRDAVYVACGSCQAVNNCNLVSNKARSNADAETRALQQPAPVRRTLPWFLDCFGGPPADA
jgi:LSD1 subclass zinc finger protein